VRRLNSLSKENIAKIMDAYQKFADLEGFSKHIETEDTVNNDYNLNVTLYVMPIEKAEKIDLAKELSELKELEKERQETTNKLEKYVSDIAQAIGEQK
jgi:type I restriction enzyme M protein